MDLSAVLPAIYWYLLGQLLTVDVNMRLAAMRICPVMYKSAGDDFASREGGEKAGYSVGDIVREAASRSVNIIRSTFDRVLNSARFFLSGMTADKVKLAQKWGLSEEETLIVLNDRNPIVRLELAWNTSVSRETLQKLIRDPDPTVAAVARRRLIKSTDEALKIPSF